MMRSNALRLTTRSLMTGNAVARHGSTVNLVAVLEVAHVQLAGRDPALAVRAAVDDHATHAADAFTTVVSNATGSSPRALRSSLSMSSISRNDSSGDTLSTW
jgi:hypothetical protein